MSATTEMAEPQAAALAEMQKPLTGRIIGITHRVKMKKDQQPRPTLVAIMDLAPDKATAPTQPKAATTFSSSRKENPQTTARKT